MNWKSTLLLVILAAAAGAWLWRGDTWVPALAPKTAPADPAALAALEADFTPAAITRIEVAPAGGDPFVFERTEKGWTQPGAWPLRTIEVNELVEALGTLRTRFRPVPLPAAGPAELEQALERFGLTAAQKPLAVRVTAGGTGYALAIGEPALKPGESPFTRPAFVRVGDAPEVLKLGPDVMPVLSRPAEAYRRRQLFADVERVKIAGAPAPATAPGAPAEITIPATVSLPGPAVEQIRVTAKGPAVFGFTPWPASGSFTLTRTGPTPAPSVTEKNAEASVSLDRLADAWAVDAPRRDRPDPNRLQQVLAAVPELWVEDFIPAAQGTHAEHPFAIARLLPVPLDPLAATLARLHPETVPDPREELKKPKRAVSVTTKDGPVTVKFGGVAKVSTREEPDTRPSPPGVPPRPATRKVQALYRYAQIEGNPQLFTVADEKLGDLFAKAGDLIDTRVARFGTDEVQTVAVAQPGKPPLVLARKKGNPKATKPEEKQDRWFIEQAPNPLLADGDRVDEFVGRLAGFQGSADSDLYRADPMARGLDPAACVTVTVVAREKRPDGDPEAPARAYKLLIGTPDFAAGKLPVQLAGWPRITLISDRLGGAPAAGWLTAKLFPERLEPVFRRDPVAYRSRKLFDTADAKLTAVTVDGPRGFALKQEPVDGREVWKLVAPLASDADPRNAAALVAQASGLEATEFVAAGADPAEYGLHKPQFTAALAFSDGRTYKLDVGGPRPGKPEVFARLDGGAVFALPVATTDALAAGALKLLPLQVWNISLDKLTGVEVTRFDAPDESFALAQDGTNWKLTGPFTAPVAFLDAQPAVAALASLPATKYEALSAPDDPAKYGFDKPLARVKLAYTEKTGATARPAAKTVLVGGAAPNGQDHYAKLDDPTAPVFVVAAGYLNAVRTAPLTLLDRNLLSLDPTKIAKVQLAGDKPEAAVTLTKGEKGAWRADGAAFAVDAVVAEQAVSTFAPLPVERLVAYGDAVKWADYGLEKPEHTITVVLGTDPPVTHTVQLGKSAPLGARFVRVDGGKAVGVLAAPAVRVLSRTKLDFADRTLLVFKSEDLVGLARTRGKEELELAPGAGDGWTVEKPAKQKADKLLVEDLADALSHLRAEKVAAFGKKDEVLKPYGLEPPEATVTLTIGEKADRKALRLGRPVDAARPDGDRYATVEAAGADATVGVLPGALANKLLAPPVSFRDRTVARFVDADKLVLERGARKVTFAKVNGTWKVTAPLAADAEQGALDDLVAELAKLRASDWVAEKPTPAELKAFGLEKPELTWTVSNGDRDVLVLRVGQAGKDGRVYATAGASGMVAVLGPPQAAKVLGEYRVRKPWALDAFQAEAVEIARGDKTFALIKNGPGWVDPSAPVAPIDPRAVTELLGALTALQVDHYAVDANGEAKLFGLEKPEVTVTVTLKDGTKRVLAVGGVVGGTNDKQRYARVVDPARTDVFVLSAADTDRFTRDRATYVQKK
ncbi:DUF4340 domain-containing protein [Frigoriglobus tundricola]|uniref:DUF4340 domain-containing protein n=1 Tax=Frigoriglobus tundricola TaxID=2774151 RepID=A0A6M5YPI3_9BACT|nr:DUF4340 domain-containing protein [Frigoriglobus tundricola]QJW95203.1 hypothetical protein FTUN_2745 [Frigoriglobus tundricola]